MLYVGLDCHKQFYMIALLPKGHNKPRTFSVRGSVATLRKETAGEPFAVCYEAGPAYGVLHDALCKIARRVVVAHPAHLRAIWQNKRKNDRVDAAMLAKLVALDVVPAVHVPSVDVRSWRRLIQHRKSMVQQRAAVKTRLRALATGCGVEAPAKAWSKAGVAAWPKLAWPTQVDHFQCENLLLELDSLDQRIKQATRQLDKIARNTPAVALLRTIPGIGPRTAETLAAWIDQPQRFRSVKQFGTYLGLVPCQDQSGSKNRFGHITREGPTLIRGLLVEAAWTAVRRDATMRAHFDRIVNGDNNRRKIAIIAIAHKLARIALAMLRSGEVYTARAA
jgi:transposase